jgi:cell division septation protein DedD
MSGPTAPPVQGRGPAGAAARPFSAPQITRLEKGKYYLQLAAFSKAELVEPELARIGKAYPLVIETAERQAKPLYRILVGPVSPGESGALLNRFKKIGYADAFIRPGV